MQKVLIFSLAYFPFVGGAEVAIKEITDRLPDFEFDMITVNLDGKQKSEEKIGRVNVLRIGNGKMSKYFFPWAAARVAKKMCIEKKYDITWAMMANQAGLAGLFFKKNNLNIPFLLTLQEGDSEIDIWLRTWFIRPLYKNIYRKADCIQAISNFLADRAKKMGAKCPVEVVPNGVGLDKFKVQSSKFKVNNEKVIITVSRLEKKNGVDVLIKSIKELRITDYELNFKLIVVGGGSMEEKLKKLAKDLGIEDRIEFIGNVIPEKVNEYLVQADIFVRPSRSEGLGNAFLEAMAMGLPVIGTPVGGISDFLYDNETGLLCTVDDPSDLAEKITLLMQDDNLYKKLSENGRKLVMEKYQWDSISIKMAGIFNGLVEKK